MVSLEYLFTIFLYILFTVLLLCIGYGEYGDCIRKMVNSGIYPSESDLAFVQRETGLNDDEFAVIKKGMIESGIKLIKADELIFGKRIDDAYWEKKFKEKNKKNS